MPILTSPPLRPAVHDLKSRAWCGLVVLSAITGAATSEVMATIQAFRGSAGPVKGVTVDEMRWVLYQHLFRPGPEAWFDEEVGPTLSAWLRARTPAQRQQTFVVMLNLVRADRRGARMNLHWAAVDAYNFVDTHTKGRPVALGKAPHRREPVMAVFPVWKEPGPGGTCRTVDGRPIPRLESCFKAMYGRKPPDEHEREHRIAAIMAELARQERRPALILAVMVLLSAVVLVVVLAYLAGLAGEPLSR